MLQQTPRWTTRALNVTLLWVSTNTHTPSTFLRGKEGLKHKIKEVIQVTQLEKNAQKRSTPQGEQTRKRWLRVSSAYEKAHSMGYVRNEVLMVLKEIFWKKLTKLCQIRQWWLWSNYNDWWEAARTLPYDNIKTKI